MTKDDEPQDVAKEDSAEACFACQNADAYWAEKARHDPALRDRILELQRLRATVAPTAPDVDDEQDGPDSTA